MKIPDWYELALLALASFRTWRLISEDDILDRPRRYVTRLGNWEKGPWPPEYRLGLAQFITCPWCLGFWISLVWWGMWEWLPHGTLVAASVASISAFVGLLERVSAE